MNPRMLSYLLHLVERGRCISGRFGVASVTSCRLHTVLLDVVGGVIEPEGEETGHRLIDELTPARQCLPVVLQGDFQQQA